MKYYVTMTDSFMSGWGPAKDKVNKLVFVCDTMDEAFIVQRNAQNRSDQKYINIRETRPYYPAARYLVQFKTKKDYPSWYKVGYFKEEK